MLASTNRQSGFFVDAVSFVIHILKRKWVSWVTSGVMGFNLGETRLEGYEIIHIDGGAIFCTFALIFSKFKRN